LEQFDSGVAPTGALAYLHRKRRPGYREADLRRSKELYEKYLPTLLQAFSDWSAVRRFVFVVCVPSSGADVLPYRDAIQRGSQSLRDLSQHFVKRAGFKATTAKSFKEVLAAITVSGINLENVEDLLILDEMVASGNSTAAVIRRARDAGMNPDARIVIAAPLVVHTLGCPPATIKERLHSGLTFRANEQNKP
jgi:hypothetical protein